MIRNQQREVRVAVAPLGRFLARVRRRLRLSSEALTVCLVTNARIASWNRAYRGKNRATDVLSFPADAADSHAKRKPHGQDQKRVPFASLSSPSYLGDIAIAPSVARRNARQSGRTFEVEMRILILHGVLHLMGYDHETDEGQMERRELRLRRELGLF